MRDAFWTTWTTTRRRAGRCRVHPDRGGLRVDHDRRRGFVVDIGTSDAYLSEDENTRA